MAGNDQYRRPLGRRHDRRHLGPGRTCEPVARLLDRVIVQVEGAGLNPELLVVAGGSADAAEDIFRVRRKAHGTADWIHSPTCRVQITLRPSGLHATASPDGLRPSGPPPPAGAKRDAPAEPADGEVAGERVTAVREALSDVIDPDLGVNIVDLGFVRAIKVEGRPPGGPLTSPTAAASSCAPSVSRFSRPSRPHAPSLT
jgi:hypothetical protein